MNDFENALIGYIGENNLTKIQKIKIGIAGAGGLGSNCAFNLVRSGFKNFIIADFDIVEYSNISRQFYFYKQAGQLKVEMLRQNMLAINPDAIIHTVTEKLERRNLHHLFKNCHVVVEAFDKAIYKKMITEEYMNSDKLLVCASGIAGWGRSDEIKIHKIKDNFYIIGDLVSEAADGLPPISPRVNIAAAKQADVILEYFLR